MQGYQYDCRVWFIAKLGTAEIKEQFLLGDICYDLETSEDEISKQVDEAYNDWLSKVIKGKWDIELKY